MHVPVLLHESVELLRPRPGGAFIDCTLGAGGHSELIWRRIQPEGRLLALDRDPSAIAAAQSVWAGRRPAAVLVRASFDALPELARDHGFDAVAGVLFDLGLSSDQLADRIRGFSLRQDGPLDMRLDRGSGPSAAEVVNELPERPLAALIRELGEERWAARIARYVVAARPLRTTRQLAATVERAIPRRAWPPGIHPATRTFQAIRMHVNDELGNLRRGLAGALAVLAPGGRIAVISFHSLEDGLVKTFFRTESRDCLCPHQQAVCTCGHRASIRLLTRRPLRPAAAELAANPRSRSARLRAAERI